ncbi:MAG: hypothetical protein MI976_31770 [Pseudomonadales bacterium]|nr:hypothetical protein [Pseudomonadales bacterium]
MNLFLVIAGILCILVGIIHSILGEILIFKNLREGSVIPTIAPSPLRERNIRILWATWHLASVFGWGLSAVLIKLAFIESNHSGEIVQYIAYSMLAAGALVFVATKAKHPGWIGLSGVAILCWLALESATH